MVSIIRGRMRPARSTNRSYSAPKSLSSRSRRRVARAGLAPPVEMATVIPPRRTTEGRMKVQWGGSSTTFTRIPRASAEARGILVNVVDDPPHCTFILPSVVRRGGMTVAISTGGASPALATRLRERLERDFGAEYERFVDLAGRIRPRIMDTIANPDERKRLWYQIVDSPVLELLRD